MTTGQKPHTDPINQILAPKAQKQSTVLELGSGCGIVGLGLAQMLPGCEVLLTDLPEAEEIITLNITASTPAHSSSTSFCVLDWEESIPESIGDRQYDLILVSDCTYNSDRIPALVRTLSDLGKTSPNAVIILSTKVRHSSEAIFFDLMSASGFGIRSHSTTPLPIMHQGGNEDEFDLAHIYVFRQCGDR